MNFKGHVAGGVAASVAVTSVSTLLLGDNAIDLTSPAIIFSSCLFMSLFPDLDTASIPQRWFYRSMLLIIPAVYLSYGKDFLLLVSLFCVIPLVHRHRGWTHWKKTPWILSVVILSIYDMQKGVYEISGNVLLINYIMFTLSIVSGHYTHLLLDSRTLKFLNNSSDHY